MADEIRKDMQKMDDDDLLSISGGVSVFSRQRPNTGTYTHVDKTVLSDVTSTAEGAVNAGMSDFIGNTTADTVNAKGLGTTMATCPKCGSTLHIVFHGGIGKCTNCGLSHDL